MSQSGARGRDPALDRPRLLTDICRRVDLPCGAFSINHLVGGRLSTARTKHQRLHQMFPVFYAINCAPGFGHFTYLLIIYFPLLLMFCLPGLLGHVLVKFSFCFTLVGLQTAPALHMGLHQTIPCTKPSLECAWWCCLYSCMSSTIVHATETGSNI